MLSFLTKETIQLDFH